MDQNRVLYFSSENCAVCHVLKPKVKELISESYPEMDWQEVMIDQDAALAGKFGVFTVPVVLILFEGKEHFRFTRGFSVGEIDQALQRPYELFFGE